MYCTFTQSLPRRLGPMPSHDDEAAERHRRGCPGAPLSAKQPGADMIRAQPYPRRNPIRPPAKAPEAPSAPNLEASQGGLHAATSSAVVRIWGQFYLFGARVSQSGGDPQTPGLGTQMHLSIRQCFSSHLSCMMTVLDGFYPPSLAGSVLSRAVGGSCSPAAQVPEPSRSNWPPLAGQRYVLYLAPWRR